VHNGYIGSGGKVVYKTEYQRTGIKESLYQFTRWETGKCGNYRAITLLCQALKMYKWILVNKGLWKSKNNWQKNYAQ
jgi:hypothetical protein